MILASIHGGMGRAARLPAVVLGLLAAGCAGSGRTVELFNGSDLGGWECRESQTSDNAWQTASSVAADPADPTRLTIVPGAGILVNGPAGRACDLHTIQTFGDCELHVEFLVPRGSNSGVYLMGEYEIQILDSWGKADPGFGDCGGVYARWIDEQNVDGHPPRVNAARPPGEWQSFDIVFRAPRFDEAGRKIANARFVRVLHNGTLVHRDVELKGPTRSSLTGQERPRGPLMLQGDHGPVAFRNIRIRLPDGKD